MICLFSVTNCRADIPEEVDGAPCAIQIITPRFQDEKCLQIADVIDRTIQG